MPHPVQGLICLLASRSKIKPNFKVFSMMIRSQVYTVLTGDHAVDLPSIILEQHILLRVLDT